MLLGNSHGKPVLLARRGGELFAIDAICTHYGSSLADGLVVVAAGGHGSFGTTLGDAVVAYTLK